MNRTRKMNNSGGNMNGMQNGRMTERLTGDLYEKIRSLGFVKAELELYLDTHPNDEKTLEQLRQYRKKAAPLIKEYEETYGALTKRGDSGNNWGWIKAPWPWECEEDR